MTTKRMGEEGVRWFIARVEDIMDPEKLGRVKIRVINEHDDPAITTDDLNWATPLIPITSASHQQIGRSPTGLLVGSTVFGFYLDGHEKQLPVLWGSYAKMPGKDVQKNDIPGLAREINTITKTPVGPEPATAYNAKYPHNHVWQTESGHVIEVDDTPSQERLHIYHKSGSYVEINHDGQKVTKVVDNDYEIVVKDKTVYIGGNLQVHVIGNVALTVDGSVTAKVGGDINATVTGKVTGSASEWNMKGPLNWNGNVNVTGNITASGSGSVGSSLSVGSGVSVGSNLTAGGNITAGGTLSGG